MIKSNRNEYVFWRESINVPRRNIAADFGASFRWLNSIEKWTDARCNFSLSFKHFPFKGKFAIHSASFVLLFNAESRSEAKQKTKTGEESFQFAIYFVFSSLELQESCIRSISKMKCTKAISRSLPFTASHEFIPTNTILWFSICNEMVNFIRHFLLQANDK